VAKKSGLGANFYVDGYDLSGDINSLTTLETMLTTLDSTGIDKFAHERIPGLMDGSIEFTAYFNPASNRAHPVLKTMPTTDRIASYYDSTTLGGETANMVAKQVSYAPTRGADASFLFKTKTTANAYGLGWATALTAGKRTDTTATTGTAVNFSAATSFGFQAYLHVFAFTGTDVTIKLQDSADNVTFADITSGAFTQTTTAPGAQRIAVGGTATVRQYVRATTVTTGGFTSVTFAVGITKNNVSVAF
jgi:hypothetical protein